MIYKQHDLFVTLENITTEQYKTQDIFINYSFSKSCFGDIIIASTTKGVCYLAFFDVERKKAIENLKNEFPKAVFSQQIDIFQQNALSIFEKELKESPPIKLHIKGTDFQIKIWKELLKIPAGKLSTYGKIASQIEKPKAQRTVGSAIGKNPVAFIIPCHRVIKSSGKFGDYRWGNTRKILIIKSELTQNKNSIPI